MVNDFVSPNLAKFLTHDYKNSTLNWPVLIRLSVAGFQVIVDTSGEIYKENHEETGEMIGFREMGENGIATEKRMSRKEFEEYLNSEKGIYIAI